MITALRRAGVRTLAALIVSATVLTGPVSAQDVGPYLLLTTRRISTMRNELNEAAAAGYRMLGAWYSYTGELVAVLEKAAGSPNTYEYRVLDAKEISELEKGLKTAAAQGFRLVPRTLTQMSDGNAELYDGKAALQGAGRIVLVMERVKGSAQRHDYFVKALTAEYELPPISVLVLPDLLVRKTQMQHLEYEIRQAVVDGHDLVAMLSWSDARDLPPVFDEKLSRILGLGVLKVEHMLISEKTVEARPPAGQQAPVAAQPERYRLLAARPGTDLQTKLSAAAAAGYRLVLSSSIEFPEIVLVTAKTGSSTNTFEYLVAGPGRQATARKEAGVRQRTTDMLTLKNQLNAAAAKGFRAYPPGIFADPPAVVTEKVTGFQDRYEYRLLEMTKLRLEKEFAEITADGWAPLGLGHNGDFMLLEKAVR